MKPADHFILYSTTQIYLLIVKVYLLQNAALLKTNWQGTTNGYYILKAHRLEGMWPWLE